MLALKRTEFRREIRKRQLNLLRNQRRAEFLQIFQSQCKKDKQFFVLDKEENDFIQKKCPFCRREFNATIEFQENFNQQGIKFDQICNFHLFEFIKLQLSQIKHNIHTILELFCKKSISQNDYNRKVVYFTELVYTLSKNNYNFLTQEQSKLISIKISETPFLIQLIESALNFQNGFQSKINTIITILVNYPQIILNYFQKKEQFSMFSFLIDLLAQRQGNNQKQRKQFFICLKQLAEIAFLNPQKTYLMEIIMNAILNHVLLSYKSYITNLDICQNVIDLVEMIQNYAECYIYQSCFHNLFLKFKQSSVDLLKYVLLKYEAHEDINSVCSSFLSRLQKTFMFDVSSSPGQEMQLQ